MIGRAIALLAAGLIVVAAGCDDTRGTGYVQIRVLPAAAASSASLYLEGTKLDFGHGSVVTLQFKTGLMALKPIDSTWAPAICKILVRQDRISSLTVTGTQNQPKCVCEIRAGQSAEDALVCA